MCEVGRCGEWREERRLGEMIEFVSVSGPSIWVIIWAAAGSALESCCSTKDAIVYCWIKNDSVGTVVGRRAINKK